MLLGMVAYWGVGLGTAYTLAFRLQWGPEGLWWGLVAGLSTAAILLSTRFYLKTLRKV